MTDQKSPLTLKQIETRAWTAKNERREKIATAIMAGMAAQCDDEGLSVFDAAPGAREAVKFAEALMQRLDEVAEETKP